MTSRSLPASGRTKSNRRAVWSACTALRNEVRDVRAYVDITATLMYLKILSEWNLEESGLPKSVLWPTIITKLKDPDGHSTVLANLDRFFDNLALSQSPPLAMRPFASKTTWVSSSKTLAKAITALDDLQFGASDDDIGDAYEYLLSRLSDAGVRGEYYTPKAVIDCVLDVMQPDFGGSFWDPACGSGGFITSIARRSFDAKLQPRILLGTELDPLSARLAEMNMVVRGHSSGQVQIGNSLSKASYAPSASVGKVLAAGGFDSVVANPPFGGHQVVTDLDEYFSAWIPTSRPESNFVQLMLRSLAPGGSLGVVVPEGFLFRREDSAIRRWMLDAFSLTGILSLPASAFEFAGVRTSLMFLERPAQGRSRTTVWMGDAESVRDLPRLSLMLLEHAPGDGCGLVDLSRIRADGETSLRPRQFLGLGKEGHPPEVTLGDLFKQRTEFISVADAETYKRVTVRTQGRGAIERDVVLGMNIGTKRQTRIHAGDLVVSKIDGRNGAMAIVPFNLDGAIVTPDFPTFVPKSERLDPELLEYFLRWGPLSRMLEAEAQGTTGRRRVSVDDIKALPIPCPSQSDQQVLLRRLKNIDASRASAAALISASSGFDWLDESMFRADASYEASLGDVTFNVSQFVTPADAPDRLWRMLSMSNVSGVQQGESRLGNTFKEGRRYKVAVPGTVAYAVDRVNVGTVGVIPNLGEEHIISPYRTLVGCTEDLLPDFLYYMMKAPFFLNRVRDSQVGAVRSELRYSAFARLRIPLPSVADQEKVIALSDRYRNALIQTTEAESAAEEVLRRTLQSLFANAAKSRSV